MTQTPFLEKQLLTVKEVAAVTGFGISTVWRKVQKGAIPQPLRLAGSTRWRRSEIEALVSAEAA
jgi:predicted DNA-binding transcriptional regulator AlpA